MKKFIMFFAIAISVMSISCSKNYTEPQNNSTALKPIEGHALFRVMSDVASVDLKAAYLSLTSEERKSVWLAHLDTFEVKHTLNEVQIDSLNSIRAFVEITNFTDTINESASVFYANWYLGAHDIFTQEEIYLMCFSLFDNLDDERASYRPNTGGGGGDNPTTGLDCNCNTSSSLACALRPDDCSTTNYCSKKENGCGFLMLYSCTGTCKLFSN